MSFHGIEVPLGIYRGYWNNNGMSKLHMLTLPRIQVQSKQRTPFLDHFFQLLGYKHIELYLREMFVIVKLAKCVTGTESTRVCLLSAMDIWYETERWSIGERLEQAPMMICFLVVKSCLYTTSCSQQSYVGTHYILWSSKPKASSWEGPILH